MYDPKTITRNQHLQVYALYTMASKLQQDVVRFEIEMNKILGLEAPEFVGSRVSDGIYNNEALDIVLGYVGITVEPNEDKPLTPTLPE